MIENYADFGYCILKNNVVSFGLFRIFQMDIQEETG